MVAWAISDFVRLINHLGGKSFFRIADGDEVDSLWQILWVHLEIIDARNGSNVLGEDSVAEKVIQRYAKAFVAVVVHADVDDS